MRMLTRTVAVFYSKSRRGITSVFSEQWVPTGASNAKNYSQLSCGLLLMMTAGCSLTVQNELNTEPRQYLADHLFTAIPEQSIETEQQIFALPDAVFITTCCGWSGL